jgi:hypothetical protein
MTSSIGSTTNVPQQHVASVSTQTQASRADSDGDNDGSKAGEVENKTAVQSEPISPTIGNNINTTA